MPKRVQEDHKHFRDIVAGRSRRELKRLAKTGRLVEMRPKGGRIIHSIPRIDIPHFLFGDNGEGVGRGPGDDGDVVGRDPQEGDGGNKPGDEHADGIKISVDLDEVLRIVGEDWKLPPMKPKPNQVFEETLIKYNDISKNGPESLRHTRRTMLEAIKRLSSMNELDKLHYIPGCKTPLKLITPINSDRRYRQYNEIRIPSSNAVIFFARDCSGSMDDYRCDVVTDMSWWIDLWLSQFYKKVERAYFVHDTRAMEVNKDDFYTLRHMGGTQCSSVFRSIADQLENRFPPEKYNVYIFYFTDGDNWGEDNGRLEKIIKEELGENVVNMLGITQVCPWRSSGSVKSFIDGKLSDGSLDSNIIRTAGIGSEQEGDGFSNWGYTPDLSQEERNQQIIDAIRKLLSEGANK